jgi:hypothetical protein
VIPDDVVRLPAGWYPDPTGLPQLRWWDNRAWTQHVTAARQPLIAQDSRSAWADELPTRRAQREREREREEASGLDGAESRSGSDAASDEALMRLAPPTIGAEAVDHPSPVGPSPVGSGSAATRDDRLIDAYEAELDLDLDSAADVDADADATLDYRPVSAAGHAGRTLPFSQAPTPPRPAPAKTAPPTPPSVGTGPAWVIAIVPLLHLVATLLVVTGIGASQDLRVVVPGIAAAVYLLVLGLAIADRVALRRSGHPLAASWTYALLGAPIYLIARGLRLSRVSGRGFGPVIVLAILGVVQLGSALAVPGLLISAVPTVFAAQAEQSVVSDGTAIGARLEVVCPPTPPILVGQQFGCAATTAAGDHYDVLVSLQRVNGWIDWRVDDWGIYTLSR